MKQTEIKLKSPAEFGFFDEIEARSRKLKRVISVALKVIGAIGVLIGLFVAFGSIGAADNGAIDLHTMVWQFWTGFIILAAGAVAWILGGVLK